MSPLERDAVSRVIEADMRGLAALAGLFGIPLIYSATRRGLILRIETKRGTRTLHDEIVVAFSCKRRGLCPSYRA